MYVDRQGAGPPVILIHGLGASGFSFRQVAAELSRRFMTYNIDLLGFGHSPAPWDFPFTMAAQAKAVMDFIDKEGISDPILIGHSMGGGICLHLAHTMSGNASSWSSRMVLLAPVAYPPVGSFPSAGSLPMPPGDVMGQAASPAAALAAFFLTRAYAPGNQPTSEQIEGYAAGLSSMSQLAAFTAHGLALGAAEVRLPSFAAITRETLVISGDQETILPPGDAAQLAGELPNATLQVIARSGHIPHEEQPSTTIDVISRYL